MRAEPAIPWISASPQERGGGCGIPVRARRRDRGTATGDLARCIGARARGGRCRCWRAAACGSRRGFAISDVPAGAAELISPTLYSMDVFVEG